MQTAQDSLFLLINALKTQADREARRNARLVRASNNAVLALQTAKTHPTAAARLAAMNYHLYPEAETSWGIFHEVFYEQQASRGLALRTFVRKLRVLSTPLPSAPMGASS